MNKFEKLIEYVIDEEDRKASDLFHEIVLEKKNSIYKKLIKDDTKEETSTKASDESSDESSTKASDETKNSDSGETSNEDSNNFKSEGDVFNGSLVPAPEPVTDEPSDTYTDTVISDKSIEREV